MKDNRDSIKLTPKNLKPPPSIQEFRESREAIKIQIPINLKPPPSIQEPRETKIHKKISYSEFLTQLLNTNNNAVPIDENYINFLKTYFPTPEEKESVKQDIQEYIKHTKIIKSQLKQILNSYSTQLDILNTINPNSLNVTMSYISFGPHQIKTLSKDSPIKFYLKIINGKCIIPDEYKNIKFIKNICETINRMFSKDHTYGFIKHIRISITPTIEPFLKLRIEEKVQIIEEIKEYFTTN